jgi:hypothetical protein
MKALTITILLIAFWTRMYGQDGSDIMYYKTSGVNSSLVGKYIHFDFYRESFHARAIDTVSIIIDNIPMKFIEHRVDHGYNNWFSKQYLQSLDKIDGQTIRITKFRLDSVTTNSFLVTMYVDIYNATNDLQADKSRKIKYQFDKKDIINVLVKSE